MKMYEVTLSFLMRAPSEEAAKHEASTAASALASNFGRHTLVAKCKRCGMNMDWGTDGEQFIPLVPIGEDDGLEMTFRDENFVLRAVHFLVCKARAIRVTRLAKPAKGEGEEGEGRP